MSEKWICEKRIFKDTWIRALHSDTNMQITDGTIPGLYLRYSRLSHQITFYMGCLIKTTGQRKNLLLGKLQDYKNVEEVKDKAREWRKQILQGINPLGTYREEKKKQVIAESKKKRVSELFPIYTDKYSKVYKKPSTQKSNDEQYKLYLEPFFADMFIDEIEEQHISDAYVAWVKKTSFSTANKALSLMSSFWNWCESYKYVARNTNPCTHIKKGKNAKYKPQILNQEGYKALFSALDQGPIDTKFHPRFFRALKILALTGCRCGEIRGLRLDEIHLDEKLIRLHDSKTGPRDVKLSDAVVHELELAVKEAKLLGSEYAFPGTLKNQDHIWDLRKPFNWALKKAKLPPMRIHDLRHSFITMGANMGENMVAMRNAAGHSRISTTEGYTHLADSKTFEAVNNVANAICG